MMKKTHETGAIMVEILAVLALIGVMGPMLYRQVLSRNQEISNVNIAAEMRAIKEAMSASIAADNAIFSEECAITADNQICPIPFAEKVEEFLPIGMNDILDDYDVKLFGYLADDGSGKNRPYVFGVAALNPDSPSAPLDWGLKRAARVASLIGADGGVAMSDVGVAGTNGTWSFKSPDYNYPENAVVITTILDTFEPDINIVDPNAVTVPEDMAFGRLHAWNYFSVGQAGKNATDRCFQLHSRQLDAAGATGDVSVKKDIIFPAGATTVPGNCDPLFWVGADKSDGTTGTEDTLGKGHVYVKNNLYIGRDNATGTHAVSIETNSTAYDGGTNADAVNKERKIVVYDIDGTGKLTIDATGRIVSNETVTVHDDKADKNITVNYGVDPSETSVLKDIRLTSRGGARLSDILPTYIAKGIHGITKSDAGKPAYPMTVSVAKPTCPQGYAAAIIVTPLKWSGSRIEQIQMPEMTVAHDLSAPAGGGSVTGDIRVPPQNVSVTTQVNREYLSVDIENGTGSDHQIGKDDATNSWTVKMGYKAKNNSDFVQPADFVADELSAVAQTYCVFDPSYDKVQTDAQDRLTVPTTTNP